MAVKRIGVFSDVHVPWHNTKALELVYHIFEELRLDEIIINGDFLDVLNVSSHGPKHPDIYTTLEEEFEAGRLLLEELADRNPKTKIIFKAGNHCHRLDRFIIKHCPHFTNLLTVEKMLELKKMKIKYEEYNQAHNVEGTNLFVQHSPPSYGVNGARTSLLKKPGASFIYGCTHRMQQAHLTDYLGNLQSVYFNGWLGSVDETPEHKRVFEYTKGHSNWQTGFSIVSVYGPNYFVDQYQIKDNMCLVDGHLYVL